MLTKAKLNRFIKMRNASRFHSNLQFTIDCNACGFSLHDLGEATKINESRYSWNTPFGLLVEDEGKLYIRNLG